MKPGPSAISLSLIAVAALLAGCAERRASLAVAPPPALLVAVVAPPEGAHPGMTIPVALADGSYPTPNRDLTAAAATWHLRAGLNVAALACRGADDAVLVARYNAMLARQRVVLARAEATVAADYRTRGGAAWRADYDGSMTGLYNFFGQSFARDAFCTASAQILAESETVEPAAFEAFAVARLPRLDRAFTDFYRRYDTWRAQTSRPAIAAATRWIDLRQVSSLPAPDGREVIATVSPRILASAQPIR